MIEAIQSITSPLALAALVLLTITGALRGVAKAKGITGPNVRLVIHYGFILTLALGMTANAAYLVDGWNKSEIRISGTIVDPAGKAVANAIVDIPGTVRTASIDTGTFEASVPRSRVRDQYKATITAPGFLPKEHVFEGRSPDPARIALDEVPIDLSGVVDLSNTAQVCHWLGRPVVYLKIDFSNTNKQTLIVDDMTVKLTSPSGKVVSLIPSSTSVPGGPESQLISMLSLKPSDKVSFIYAFVDRPIEMMSLVQRASNEAAKLPAAVFDPVKQVLSQELTHDLTSYFSRALFFEAGTIQMTFEARVGSVRRSVTRSFNLSDHNIVGMRGIAHYFASGAGVLPALSTFSDERAQPMILARLATE